MNSKLDVKQSVIIKAPVAKVWDSLVNPEKIRRYLFGTDAVSDWKKGSPIRYSGVWNGKAYEDKGKILNIVPGKLLETTFWSSSAGLPDVPENYKKIVYKLSPLNGATKLVIIQDNNATEEEKKHSELNWKMVLDNLKELVESQK